MPLSVDRFKKAFPPKDVIRHSIRDFLKNRPQHAYSTIEIMEGCECPITHDTLFEFHHELNGMYVEGELECKAEKYGDPNKTVYYMLKDIEG